MNAVPLPIGSRFTKSDGVYTLRTPSVATKTEHGYTITPTVGSHLHADCATAYPLQLICRMTAASEIEIPE